MQTAFAPKVSLLVLLLALARSCLMPDVALGAITLYDAALGTIPQEQGWVLNEDIMPPTGYPVSVDPDGLYLSTLAFGTNDPPNFGGGVWWSNDSLGIDFTEDFAVEASVKILTAPNHSINRDTGWPRPGYAIAVTDVHGTSFWVGLGSGEVFLSNTFYGQYGTPNTVYTSFVTTDQHHVYRIERASGGVGAALRIDGVLKLELPALGPVESTETLYFGDPTYWANSESYTAWVRYEVPGNVGVIPPSPSRLLWVSPMGNPARTMRIGFTSPLAGTLTLEVFDLMGRPVERFHRIVSLGQSGSFESSQVLPAGIYIYRVTLAPPIGNDIVSSGRIAIVR